MRAKLMHSANRNHGFTLVELVVAVALGLMVMAALTSLFKSGMDATFVVTQRAELQQNMRAAIELLSKDISMAGSGLPSGGVQLPSGAGSVVSRYGCDQTGACHVPVFQYPNGNYMFGIIPGFNNGVEAGAVIPAAPGQVNDSITVIYADYNFPLNEYDVNFPAGGPPTGVIVNIAANPAFIPAPPLVTAAGGLQVGDLILLSNSAGNAVGEVTGFTAGTISFADLDPLQINQSGAAANNIAALAAGGTMIAYRLFAVTYYLTVPVNGQTPRLMRQVNGLAPVPVADNIVNLQFAFDVYNSTNNALDSNQADPLGVGESPNLIQKVNMSIMGESLVSGGRRSQNMALATSVSARNMAFRNRYQ
jgi:prepilin-type N-terminal cleavage/methylation domain-containing protein